MDFGYLKEQLKIDLCARIIYGVKVNCVINFSNDLEVMDSKDIIRFIPKEIAIDSKGVVEYLEDNDEFDESTREAIQDYLDMKVVTVDNLIPYLRPISDMRENEREEFEKIRDKVEARFMNAEMKDGFTLAFTDLDDFLNKRHFDHRGFIGAGLAEEVKYEFYFS